MRQFLYQRFDHQSRLFRRHREEFVKAEVRLLIGHVRDSAYHHERHVEVMADVGDSGGFHLYGDRVGEVMPDFRQPDGTVNKRVAANNKAAYRVQIQIPDAGFRGGDQLIMALNPAGQPGNCPYS